MQMILTANFAVLLGEVAVMFLLPLLNLHNDTLAAILDASMLMAISTPVMYLLLRKSELDFEVANRELGTKMAELNARARDSALLEEMGELMLATRNPEETYTIVARYIGRLFPGTNGSFYVLRNSRNSLEEAGAWGEPHHSEPWFGPEECWAFRRGKRHEVNDDAVELSCNHVRPKSKNRYCCLPMIANGEALGLLYIESSEEGSIHSEIFKFELLASLVEHIALALSNNRLQQKLKNQSIRDPLTGLFNRRFLEESLSKELHRALRKPEPVGVVMLDLDHFKSVNDEYGHDAGDALLRAVAAQLQKDLRIEDIACRLGGEEFVLILPGISLEHLQVRSVHLLRTLPELQIIHNGRLLKPITASMGLASFPQHGADPGTLLRAADSAMYVSKDHGRNCATVATSLEATSADKTAVF
jgi:diguanylate cyclase (GGDEF)-like protein